MPQANITYSTSTNELHKLDVSGFFADWRNKPSDNILRQSVDGADCVVLAIDAERSKLAGYITSITDGALSAYIPFLEVEKSYQGQGIGHALVKKILKELDRFYMIDLVCDEELAGFYEEAGFRSRHAMTMRNYSKQYGASSVD